MMFDLITHQKLNSCLKFCFFQKIIYICVNSWSMKKVLLIMLLVAGGFVNSSFTVVSNHEECNELGEDPKAYPNPFKSKITIVHSGCDRIDIVNLLGETVKVIQIPSYEKVSTLDLSELKKGVYFYAIKDGGQVLETRRIVKSE
jgi:hypothetical protein